MHSHWQRRAMGLAGGILLVGVFTASAEELPIFQMPVGPGELVDPIPWVDPRVTHVGTVTSQGDNARVTSPGAVQAALARSTYAVDGSGVVVGIISDSYDADLTAGASVIAGDLPGIGNPNGFTAPVQVLDDDLSSFSIDEGRAIAEIVHDLAPGATILFHSAFNNGDDETSIATAIDALRLAGADVIIDDVGYLNQPFFQDGWAARATDAAFAAGCTHFSSAGNSGRDSYEGVFVSMKKGATTYHDFSGGLGDDNLLDIVVPADRSVRVTLQWIDPFPSLSPGITQAANDFDLFAVYGAAQQVVDLSTESQVNGADPWELVLIDNDTTEERTYGLAIVARTVADPNIELKLVLTGSVDVVDDADTNSPTIYGHTAAAGAMSLAAIYYGDTTVESYSSRGPVRILFDEFGTPTSEVRDKPNLTATDGVDTTFFGSDSDGSGFPNFFGTSAAAPHAGAVAALIIQRGRDLGVELTPAEIYAIMQETAYDLHATGFDFDSGFGLVDAMAAVTRVADYAPVLGDFTGDGLVTAADFPGFLACFAGGGSDCELADMNQDGLLDLSDVALFQGAMSP